MKNAMDYDSTNWKAEKKRIVAAFDVAEPCEFSSSFDFMCCKSTERTGEIKDYQDLLLKNGLFAAAQYGQNQIYIAVSQYDKLAEQSHTYFILLNWAGKHVWWGSSEHHEFTPPEVLNTLARGLFFLDLLTPEIERDLNLTICNHQKLEWQLEYEERYGL